jgi:hypothetical protein
MGYRLISNKNLLITGSVSDPGSGIFLVFDPWIRDGKIRILDPGSGTINSDHISRSLATLFSVKNTEILCCGSDPGSGAFFILDPGSGINIPDSQH